MQMKKNIFKTYALIVALIGFYSCGDDFLSVNSTEQLAAGAPSTQKAIEQNLASAYQILLFDSYAEGNYNSYILMGDLRSDDIYKGGGDLSDQAGLYYLSQFKNTPSDVPGGWWPIYYTGLSRCNTAIQSCENATADANSEDVARMSAEAYFLRAYYVHHLWKIWGNIPYFDRDIPAPYFAKQYTADQVYTKIMEDLDYACQDHRLPLAANSSTMGRATKPAAQMLRARVAMYQNDSQRYNQILADMVEIINNPAFELMPSLEDVFIASGEFCKESIFETNQKADGKTWGNAWLGFGTNLPAFISPSGLEDPTKAFIGGWGFAPARTQAYQMYHNDDERRGASINDFRSTPYSKRWQDTGFFMRKYAAREGYNAVSSGDRDLNFDNNLRIFRLPEAYLNAAELIIEGASAPGAQSAQNYLDVVRKRAFGHKFDQNKIIATLENVKSERRLEFFGEGLRYWDLVRWGDAERVLTENDPAYAINRTWTAKSKYLPIPQGEVDRTKGMGEFELIQNEY